MPRAFHPFKIHMYEEGKIPPRQFHPELDDAYAQAQRISRVTTLSMADAYETIVWEQYAERRYDDAMIIDAITAAMRSGIDPKQWPYHCRELWRDIEVHRAAAEDMGRTLNEQIGEAMAGGRGEYGAPPLHPQCRSEVPDEVVEERVEPKWPIPIVPTLDGVTFEADRGEWKDGETVRVETPEPTEEDKRNGILRINVVARPVEYIAIDFTTDPLALEPASDIELLRSYEP